MTISPRVPPIQGLPLLPAGYREEACHGGKAAAAGLSRRPGRLAARLQLLGVVDLGPVRSGRCAITRVRVRAHG